jgi:hypothetical protein
MNDATGRVLFFCAATLLFGALSQWSFRIAKKESQNGKEFYWNGIGFILLGAAGWALLWAVMGKLAL